MMFLFMRTGTYPEMEDHICHIKKKIEMTIQHNNDTKPCGFEGLKMEI